jgi:precorrin-3B synthase
VKVAETTTARDRADQCPGVLRPHHAADGELLRLRLPGGALAPRTLIALAAASRDWADGRIGLTSRANVQLRGVAPAAVAVLMDRIQAAGLLPAPEHERVRNIIASPLSGRGPGSVADVDGLARDLDVALCARPKLSELPGRFLFALDDGTLDVAAEGADVTVVALGRDRYSIRPAGADRSIVTDAGSVVAVVLALAEAFLAVRAQQSGRAWRVKELRLGGVEGMLARVGAAREAVEAPPESAAIPAPGLLDQRDGRVAVVAVVPLGLIDSEQAEALAAATQLATADDSPTTLRITPWRRVVIRDLELPAALAARELLAAVGLVVEPGTAWSRITACAGRPGCARSLRDVQADARGFAADCDPDGAPVHWVGCDHACGSPSGAVSLVLATESGYRISGVPLSAGDRRALARIETVPEARR